ncbi:autotransporter outer membrane beta-barrel domain-containing protein [Bartonella sp. CB189]|uniref:autotransporter outer membrane beta-barrel domain-containing protein n=1 Tax=Bartonella sp. CB189 TaxID=3112254 RepID=UPI002F9609C6
MKKRLFLCTVSGILFYSYADLSYASADNSHLNETIIQSKDEPTLKDVTFKDITTQYPGRTIVLSNEKVDEKLKPQNSENGKSEKMKKLRTASDSAYHIPPQSAPYGNGYADFPRTSGKEETTKPRRRPSLEPTTSGRNPAPNGPEAAAPEQKVPIPKPSEQAKPEISHPEQMGNAQHRYHAKVEAKDGKTVTHRDVAIYDRFFSVSAQGERSLVSLIGGSVNSNFVAINAEKGGTVDGANITVTAVSAGLLNLGGTIKLEDSTVTVTGNRDAYGIFFKTQPSAANRQNVPGERNSIPPISLGNIPNTVLLFNTTLSVENGIGIYAEPFTNGIVKLDNSNIVADVLLKSEHSDKNSPHTLVLTASQSTLEGPAKMLGKSQAMFDLHNGTKWILTSPQGKHYDRYPGSDLPFDINDAAYSNLFMLSLQNSSIVFSKPKDGHYKTLYVGYSPLQANQQGMNGDNKETYSAEDHAEIYFNSKWSNDSTIQEQQTDRFLVSGGVLGTTIIHVDLSEDEKQARKNSSLEKDVVSIPVARRGISLVQVLGNAKEDSFKLKSDYIVQKGSPYKYVLTAYKPGTSDASQNLFGMDGNDFWDFRLQNEYIDGDKKVRAVLPQVANYLVMPSAVFASGLSDINNQNMLIDNIRMKMSGPEDENNNNKGIFLSSYGNKLTFFSSRDPNQYGYGADINYTALQAGGILTALEGENITTDFGLLGTFGKLTFSPKGMKDSEKTMLDKWSLTAYSGVQHSSGLYVNAFLSYGVLKGNIAAPLIKSTTKLKNADTLSASATVGQKLETNIKELVFEPQAQLTYQNLMLNTISDAEGFEVDMKNPHQWLIRIGGRLTQSIFNAEEGRGVSFYGKLNVLRAFGDNGTIRISNNFHTDSIGSSIEGGIGVDAHLSQNIALYGNVSYQHKLQKAGVSGASFSGGIRYNF